MRVVRLVLGNAGPSQYRISEATRSDAWDSSAEGARDSATRLYGVAHGWAWCDNMLDGRTMPIDLRDGVVSDSREDCEGGGGALVGWQGQKVGDGAGRAGWGLGVTLGTRTAG